MDFEHSPRAQEYIERVGRFIRERILPSEAEYYGELTHTEIAAHLDLPVGTVKGRMRLGLEKLRHGLRLLEMQPG